MHPLGTWEVYGRISCWFRHQEFVFTSDPEAPWQDPIQALSLFNGIDITVFLVLGQMNTNVSRFWNRILEVLTKFRIFKD